MSICQTILALTALVAPLAAQAPNLTLAVDQTSYQALEKITFTITGDPGTRIAMLVDLDGGPSMLPVFGEVAIGQSPFFLILEAGAIPASGVLELRCSGPCYPPSSEIFLQLIGVNPDPFSFGVSNPTSFLVTDPLGVCSEPPCVAMSVNDSNFNGTSIDPGSKVWFNSVVKVRSIDTADGDCTVGFRNVCARFEVGGAMVMVPFPNSVITYSSTATTASTSFNEQLNQWNTTVPIDYDGNVFLSGYALDAPNGLPGGINPVCWSGEFVSDKTGLSFQWKWGAAVYTQFSCELDTLGVKPIDGSQNNPFPNSHKAGSPENFLPFVTGGARGGGGSNFTGSYSGTETVDCD